MTATDYLTAAGATLSAALATYATHSPAVGIAAAGILAYPTRTAAREGVALGREWCARGRAVMRSWLVEPPAAPPAPPPGEPLPGILVDVRPVRPPVPVARRLPPLPVARRAAPLPAPTRLPAPRPVEPPTEPPAEPAAAWLDEYPHFPPSAWRGWVRPAAPPEPVTRAPAPTRAEPEYVPGRVYSIDSACLIPDPGRFQFKVDGVRGPHGVTAELASVTSWNPVLAGVLLVWRDPATGIIHPVNGHHRHELRTRTGGGPMNVLFSGAPDAQTARAEGALANLAEGRGTALDCARWLRDTGRTADDLAAAGVSLAGKLVADGIALAGIGEPLWRRVLDGRTVPADAIVIGRFVSDPDAQSALAKRADERDAAGNPWCGRQLEAAARKLGAAASVTVTTSDLFGESTDELSTWEQEVEIEAHCAAAFRRESLDFRAVSSDRRAARVSEAGNVLQTEVNRSRAAAAAAVSETFARLVNLRGPVSAAVQAAAAQLATARTERDRHTVLAAALESVRAAVAQEIEK